MRISGRAALPDAYPVTTRRNSFRTSAIVLGLVGGVVGRNNNDAGLVRAVGPGVVGATLDDSVTFLEMHLFLVEDQSDFTFEDVSEIVGLGFLHVGVPPVLGVSAGTL